MLHARGTNPDKQFRRRCGGWTPPGGPVVSRRPSGRAPPGSQIYRASAGPPPFSGPSFVADRLTVREPVSVTSSRVPSSGGALFGGVAHGADGPQVGELGLHDGVHLLGQVRLARSPPTGSRCSRRSRRRRRSTSPGGCALEPLPVTPWRWKNSSWKSRIRRTSSGVRVAATRSGRCCDDPLERLVHVEHRRRRLGRHAPGLPDHEPRRRSRTRRR